MGEIDTLTMLDEAVRDVAARRSIDEAALRVRRVLTGEPSRVMAWESLPLSIYRKPLPEAIRSSWVFILRAGVATGAERHPNSHQRMMSYQGNGDFQTREDDSGEWTSHFLVSRPDAAIQDCWISIPAGVWHQSASPPADWVVVSFHTVRDSELIEERPGDDGPIHRHYVD